MTNDQGGRAAQTECLTVTRVADRLAQRLCDAGVRFAFGIPGGEVLTLLDALGRAGIDFVVARHETAAGFMGEGIYRLDETPAVLLATLGPGVANTVNVTANAQQDQVPLIVLGGRVSEASQPAYTHQVFDQSRLFEPITKATFELDANVDELMTRALEVAYQEPRGPVYIDCPLDIADRVFDPSPEISSSVKDSVPPTATLPSSALECLAQAQRPLVLAGLRAMGAETTRSLRQFLRTYSFPIITSYKAKGVEAETSPLSLGGAGLSPLADSKLLPLVAEADLVILVGYDPIEMRHPWIEPFSPKTKVLEIDSARLEKPYVDWGLYGEIALLLDGIEVERSETPVWPNQEPQRVQEALATAFAPRSAWEPTVLIQGLQEMIDPQALLTVDTGAHRILFSHVWMCDLPGQVLQSTGFCTMACALPLAIGAKIRQPHREVVAIVGDGGLEMGLGELATLRDCGQPVIVVVIDDSSYALIDMKQRAREFACSGVMLGATDFARVAEAMGGVGVRVHDRAEFEQAFGEAKSRERFTIIHAPFAKGVYDGRI